MMDNRTNRRGPRSSGSRSHADSDEALLKQIITDPNAAQETVEFAEQVGADLKNQGLSTSQIRSLFTEVRQIEADWQHEPERARRRLVLLKPKMAYRARKERGRAVQTLVDILDQGVDLVDGDAANFRRFVEFFESILAYHRAHGGS